MIAMDASFLQKKRRSGDEEQGLLASDVIVSSNRFSLEQRSQGGLQVSAAILNGESHSIRLIFSSSPVKAVEKLEGVLP
jgi:hypothetical protein